jgi:hypothetical protein
MSFAWETEAANHEVLVIGRGFPELGFKIPVAYRSTLLRELS